MPPFDPSNQQPLVVFFELNVGGLTNINVNPHVALDFEYKMVEGSVRISLFDQTGGEVEPYLWAAMDPQSKLIDCTFKYGYKGKVNIDSGDISFQIEHWDVLKGENSYTVNLYGDVLVTPFLSDNPLAGTMEKVFKDFSDIHLFTPVISPALGKDWMKDVGYNDKDSTDFTEMTHRKLATESDMSYIHRIVQDYAVDQNGKGGYRVSRETKDGEFKLHIYKADSEESNSTYDTRVTPVVLWNPTICGSAGIWGAGNTDYNTYERCTGYEIKGNMSHAALEQYQTTLGADVKNTPIITQKPDPGAGAKDLTYTCADNMPDDVTKNSVRSRSGGSISPYAGINRPMNQALGAWMECMDGTLTILGDPKLDPWKKDLIVEVDDYYPNTWTDSPVAGQKHYSSGKYMTDEITHVIKMGEYTSILELERCALPDMPQPQGQQQ